MKAVVLLVLLALFAACGPVEPSGMASSAISADGDVRISHVALTHEAPYAVKLFVRGDVVSEGVSINGAFERLSGVPAREGWLFDDGTVIVYLERGIHSVEAVSCVSGVFGFDCERIARDIRVPH